MQLKLSALIFTVSLLVLSSFKQVCAYRSSLDSECRNLVSVDIRDVGTVIGSFERTSWSRQVYMKFLSIPYAASPSGRLRFKPPRARRPWDTPYDATQYGRRCPEIETIAQLSDDQLDEDLEDCLSLCIYTKYLEANQPVMVYLYGGGFNNGSSDEYPARYLLEKNVVLVVPQYRIGALGWMSTRTVHIPGNVAIADVIFAVKWIRLHINEFGGDPNCVTLMGQSAGAAIAGALLLSPKMPNGFVHRAILQSGSILSSWAINTDPRPQAEFICEALKCTDCGTPRAIYNCLKNVHTLNLLEVTSELTFSPSLGDYLGIIPLMPQTLLEQYDCSIPIMTGFTKHDGSFIVATLYDEILKNYGTVSFFSVRQFATQLLSKVTNESHLAIQAIISLLFSDETLRTSNHRKALPAYFDLASTVYIKSPIIAMASHIARNRTNHVFLYTFDYEGRNTRFGYEHDTDHYPFYGGVHHSNENIYLFSTHKLNWRDTQMAKKMVGLWTTFARGGIPYLKNISPIMGMKNDYGPYFHINKWMTSSFNVLNELRAALNDPTSKKLFKKKSAF